VIVAAVTVEDIQTQLKQMSDVLVHAAATCNNDRSSIIAALTGALIAICACSDDRDNFFQVAQDALAQARTMCLARGTTPAAPAVPS
jgi:hypothetical protein